MKDLFYVSTARDSYVIREFSCFRVHYLDEFAKIVFLSFCDVICPKAGVISQTELRSM